MNNEKLVEELVKLAERVVKGWILAGETIEEAIMELKKMIDTEHDEIDRIGDRYDALLTHELLDKAKGIIEEHENDFKEVDDVDEIAILLFDQEDKWDTDEERDAIRTVIEEGLEDIEVSLS